MSIDMDVEIYYRGQARAVAKGRTRDLSGSGMSVEVVATTIAKNTFVDVKIVLPSNVKGRSFQVSAIVTHANAGGLGLMFVDLDPGAYERIIRLLKCNLIILADWQGQGFVDR